MDKRVVLVGNNAIVGEQKVIAQMLFGGLQGKSQRDYRNLQAKMFYMYKTFDAWVNQPNVSQSSWVPRYLSGIKEQVLYRVDRDSYTLESYRWYYVTPDRIVCVLKSETAAGTPKHEIVSM